MIVCKTELDKEAQKALTRTFFILSLVSLIVGAIGLVLYIVLNIFLTSSYLDVLLVCSLPFGFGLVYIIMINNIIERTSASKIVNEYTFENDYFMVSSIKNGEVVSTNKIYYKEIYKIKEKDGYLLLYINLSNAYIIKEGNLSSENLTLLKAILKIGKNETKENNI